MASIRICAKDGCGSSDLSPKDTLCRKHRAEYTKNRTAEIKAGIREVKQRVPNITLPDGTIQCGKCGGSDFSEAGVCRPCHAKYMRNYLGIPEEMARAACLRAQTQLTDRPGTGERSFLDRSGDGAVTICLSQVESP